MYRKSIIFLMIISFFTIFFMSASPPMPVLAATETSASVIVKEIHHKHTGSSSSYGGCYTIARTETQTHEERCPGILIYYPATDSTGCSVCGAGYHGDYYSGSQCIHTTTVSEQHTYYALDCGKSTSTVVGTISVTYEGEEWLTEVPAKVEYTSTGMTVLDKAYVMNGESSDTGDFIISENGEYIFTINADANSDTARDAIAIQIKNIDKTAPQIAGISADTTDWTSSGVTVTIEEPRDLQPDQTEGCGLHDQAYSFDNGQTWTDLDTCLIEQNSTVEVAVRDKLMNTYYSLIEITNIDNEAPNILNLSYDKTQNIDSTTIRLTADDIMKDGREGAGLDEAPFSFDGGKSWTKNGSFKVTQNGTYHIHVRDRLGNTAIKKLSISNLDNYKPTVRFYLTPGYWTNGPVEVTFIAADVNPDGSDGIGLHEKCFSYDSGRTWTDNDTAVAADNCDVHVAVRDKLGNTIYTQAPVANIDKVPPVISLSYTLINDGRAAQVTATAVDDLSGIASDSYSWNNGQSTGDNSILVAVNGTVTASIKDNAGNEATASIEIAGVKIPVKKKPLPPAPPIETEEEAGVPEAIDFLPKTEEEIVLPAYTSPNTSMAESDSLAAKDSGWWESLTTLQKFLFVFLLLLLAIGLLLLLLLYIRSVSVYSVTEESARFLGMKWIGQKDDCYCVTLPEELWNKAISPDFSFKFSFIFAAMHRNEQIYLYFPGHQPINEEIRREVEVNVL